MTTAEKLKQFAPPTPGHWREDAKYRLENLEWRRRSQKIAMHILNRLEELGMTQKDLAEHMGCSQQYISKLVKGRENLSLETICKLEKALDIQILQEVYAPVCLNR